MRSLPKVELHLHLDCSLSYEVVARIDPRISRPDYECDFIAPAKCTNLADFLTRAPKGFGLMQTEEQLRLVTNDLFQQLQADNVIYAEIRFAPLLHLQNGLSAEQVVQAIVESTRIASRETGIEAGAILCTLRHFTAEESLETAHLANKFRNQGVVAIDIAGDEAGFPLSSHGPAFEYAVRQAIPRTCHAGEACGAESVWETLRLLQPSRIGHGVRSIEDPALVEHLKQHKIHLEVCPTSNIQTDIYARYSDHPIKRLYDLGVEVGINTDARTITNITLTQEYEKLERHFGWGPKEFLACNLNALRAAFASDSTKQSLTDKLSEFQFMVQ